MRLGVDSVHGQECNDLTESFKGRSVVVRNCVVDNVENESEYGRRFWDVDDLFAVFGVG